MDWAMMGRVLPLLLLLMVAGRGLAAQTDSGTMTGAVTGGSACAALAQARPDSMVPVDSEAKPERLVPMEEGPRDADQRAVVAHFVVTPEGRVDTTTVQVERTRDAAWIARLRRALAGATYTPAWSGGCPVARWSTFAVWSGPT